MIRDTRMMAKALEQRWPIKPEYRQAIVNRLVQIVANPKSSPREVTAASRSLLSAEAQNQQDEQHIDGMDDSRNRILTILARVSAGDGDRITDQRGTADAGICDQDA